MLLRIAVPGGSPLGLRDDPSSSSLRPRQDQPLPPPPSPAPPSAGMGAWNIIVAVIVGIIGLALLVVVIRAFRARHPNPKYIPTPFLKRIWSGWKVGSSKTGYQRSDGDTHMREAQADLEASLADQQTRAAANGTGGANASTAAIDRNTSVRSVMTLPPYRPKASETEHVLGREGERDGIDVVVEMPTAEDEEALREEEMDALYQIRLARRRQIAEREERRQARREARERNDLVALQNLRDQARNASTNNTQEIESLRGEHERIKESRHRAVSSVSYADLGVARHDGTRIRANSNESERMGLLSDAASIALSVRPASSLQHRREHSASSVLSIDTFRSEGQQQPGSPGTGGGRPRSQTGASSGRDTPGLSRTNTRAGSSPELIDAAEADLGDIDMPPHSPPGYDDVSLDEVTPAHSRAASPYYPEPPPDYPGPTQARNQRLSAHVADLVAEAEAGTVEDDRQSRRSSRGIIGLTQLPSLRLSQLPQIIIEPSSAAPRE